MMQTIQDHGAISSSFQQRVKTYKDLRTLGVVTARNGLTMDYYASSSGSSSYWVKDDYTWTDFDQSWRQTDSLGHDTWVPYFPLSASNNRVTSLPDKDMIFPGEFTVHGQSEGLSIGHYRADGVVWPYHSDLGDGATMDGLLTVSAGTQMKLFTGGKAKIKRKNLFCLSAS